MYKNSIIDAIVAHYGVSYDSLANLIGTSRDFVKSAAIGRRALDLQHVQLLIRLEQALALGTPLEPLPPLQGVKDGAVQKLKSHVANQQRSLATRKDQLKQLETSASQMQRGLNASKALLEGTLSEEERKWVALREGHLTEKLSETRPKIVWQKAKIAGLEAEVKAFNRLMEDIQ